MKALVTGAAGFIGSTLSEHLLGEGADVVGLDCFTDYYARSLKEANVASLRGHPRFTFVEAALQDADLDAVLDGVTHVFHLAAQAGVRKSWGSQFDVYVVNNIGATQHLLERCAGRPLERFVYASTSSVYGDAVAIPMREDARPHPVSPYGVTKLAAEHLCFLYQASYGVPCCAVRYFTVYGPRQRPDMGFHRFLTAAIEGRAITRFGDGEQTRDFTFVADAVAATTAAGQHGIPGEVYNVGGGSRVSVNEVFDLVAQVTGRPVQLEVLPAQMGDMRDTYADTSRARQTLGFQPSVTLADGLLAEYQWLLSTRS